MMKRSGLVLISLFVSVAVFGCGGKSVALDEPLAADAGNDDASGSGGGGSGGAAGTGGTAGEAGSGGSMAGSGGDAGTGGTGGTGVVACALVTGDAACDDCMNGSCADPCNTCAGNAECSAFVTCALACATGDTACMQACTTDHEAGVQDGLPLVGPTGCLREQCNSECIASGKSCSISMGDAACDACVVGYCMTECTTCADNAACVSVVDCVKGCDPSDQACTFQCGIQDPGGIGDANAFAGTSGCVAKHCSVACNGAPSQCGIQLGVPDCDTCIASQCLASCNTCAANTSCVDLVDCASACATDDQACLTQCAIQSPGGIADANAFMGDAGCVAQKCPAECGKGAADCTLQTGNSGCDSCIATQCTGSCSTCSANPACVALVACNLACDPGDIGCEIQCGVDNSGGIQDANALIGPTGCVGSDCSFWCP